MSNFWVNYKDWKFVDSNQHGAMYEKPDIKDGVIVLDPNTFEARIITHPVKILRRILIKNNGQIQDMLYIVDPNQVIRTAPYKH